MSKELEVQYMYSDDVPSGCSSLDNLGPSTQTKLFYVSSMENKFVLNICSNDIATNKVVVVKNDVATNATEKCVASKKVQNMNVEPVWVKRGSQNNLCNGLVGGGAQHGLVSLTHLPKRMPIDIEFSDITYSVSEGRKRGYKTILKNINGKVRSGELSAIMGPSGAGKSTLMNILAGYKTSNLCGKVQINGKERNLRRFRKLSSYIMQDDRLLPYLSVREAMMVSANLKLGPEMTSTAKKVVVEEIIETLGLSEASNTRTLNLSGGQRKRLSVALELVNNPPVMFFDEPTSGLDSASCFQLICLLKSLARGGRTIVCTIHQPSARLFEMFDFLYMLAEGQCIFQGRVNGLVPFLSALGYECPSYHNPADYVMEVACGEHGDCVTKLVMAVNNGKCNNYNQPLAQNLSKVNGNNTKNISQDLKQKSTTSLQAVNLDVSSDDTLLSKSINKPTTDFTVVNIPSTNNDEQLGKLNTVTLDTTTTPSASLVAANQGNSNSLKPTSGATCTTSLLDSIESVNITLPNKSFPTSTWQQFWILLKRSFLTIWRDQTLTHMRLYSHVIVGAIIGMIYYDVGEEASKIMSNAGCVFFTTLFVMFTAMMPTILTFPTEMSVFIREHLNYWYSLKSFYLAKTVADLPFQILFTSVYVIVVYYLTSQPLEPKRMGMFVLICILTSLVAQSLGLLIGAGMSVEIGTFMGPVTTIPTILFSGFFVNFDVIPSYLKWVTYVSYVRYGFEGAMYSIYGMDREKLKCSQIYCHFRSPKKFLEEMSLDDAEYWIDATALFGFFVVLRIIAYFVLRWKLHSVK